MSLMIAISESAEDLSIPRYSSCSCASTVSSIKSAIPMMPCMGVRISWLMRARNSLFARLAVSAASLASRSASSARLRTKALTKISPTILSSLISASLQVFSARSELKPRSPIRDLP